MIEFSARHDKCLPASALVAIKDKTLLVVFPSLEVCNNVADNFYSFSLFFLLFIFLSPYLYLTSFHYMNYTYVKSLSIIGKRERMLELESKSSIDLYFFLLSMREREREWEEEGREKEEKTLNLFQPISLWRKCIFPLRSSRLSRIDSKSQAALITRRTTSHRDVARTRKGLRVMDGRKSFRKLLFFPRVYLSPTNFRST